jgi:D-glycero-beta-D-manno-heptose-7-phosphate kinase
LEKGPLAAYRDGYSVTAKKVEKKKKSVAASSFKRYLSRFRQTRLLVVGDLMLDHYIWGKVSRISPEAPVPVVNVTSESLLLGGAANVANNVLSLGGQVDLCGVVGPDDAGRKFLQALDQAGLGEDGIVVEKGRQTTKKTRIIAHSQQVVRFDREQRDEISKESQQRLSDFIHDRIKSVDGIIVSDYAKGVVTPNLMQGLMSVMRRNGISVIVDPKVHHLDLYQGVTVVTPNHLEAAQATGIQSEGGDGLMTAGRMLLKRLNSEAVLITRGEHGMSLFERRGTVTHIPTTAKAVFDVTGAGDTVVSALGLALAAGASMQEAAILSNLAAGIVVGIVGTATANRAALEVALERGG